MNIAQFLETGYKVTLEEIIFLKFIWCICWRESLSSIDCIHTLQFWPIASKYKGKLWIFGIVQLPKTAGSLSYHNGDADAEDNVDLKMTLYFTYESRGYFWVIYFVYNYQNYHKNYIWDTAINLKYNVFFKKKKWLRSLDNAEFGHFTLLFFRGRHRNVPRIITHVHSHCSVY